jgi:hypothetical protein
MDTLIKCLTTQDVAWQPQLRIFNVLCSDKYLANYIAKKAHQHPSLSPLFSSKARSGKKFEGDVLAEVLEQISAGVQRIVVNSVPVPAGTGGISRSVSWTGTEEVSSHTASNLGQFRPIRSISPVPGGTQHTTCPGTGHGPSIRRRTREQYITKRKKSRKSKTIEDMKKLCSRSRI